MMENAGKLKIPFTTGLLLGIGETETDREESLQAIAALHKKYGHIQEVIIQNFCPKEGTEMAAYPGAGFEVLRDTLILASGILPEDVSVQIPPNLADASQLLSYGVTDLGGVSPVTIDYINPEHPWPALDSLREIAGGRTLRERLCVYPQYCNAEWIAPELLPLVQKLAARVYT
jgi:FO synthase subunit 1